jgi:hypothetical protein
MSDPLDDLRAPETRRTATVVAVAFAALLCVVGLVLAYRSLTNTGSGGDGVTAEETAGPQSSGGAAAGGQPPASQAPQDQVQFASPSGNIGCTLSSAGARCDIAERSWEPPPKPESCTVDWGQGLTVTGDAPTFVCAGDSVLGSGEKLAYGKTLQRGDFSCLSEKDGMRCQNTKSGRGFVVARASYAVF